MKRIVPVALLILAITLVGIAQTQQPSPALHVEAKGRNDVQSLEAGKPVQRELAGGQSHEYQITLDKEQYLHVVVEQRGIDVVIVLFAPGDKKLVEVDSPNGSSGPEVLALLTDVAGNYRVEVRSLEKDAAPGKYEIKLVELRQAKANDRPLVEARNLAREASLLKAQGKNDEALPLAEKVLALREKVLGADHLDVGAALNFLVVLHLDKGDFQTAEPLCLLALGIREKALGADHLDVATSLNNLALIYNAKGANAEAEPLYQRALAINEKILGPDHPEVARLLFNLAILYSQKGNYAKAELMYQQAIAIWEKSLGSEHPDLARPLFNLANLYNEKGDYTKAEPLHLRVLAIMEKAMGPDDPNVAVSLNSLAGVYNETGDYARAELLFLRALTILEKKLGPNHLELAYPLNNLATLYHEKGDYAKAEPLYQRSLAIREKVLGPNHSIVAILLDNFATMYRDKGDYSQAEPRYQRALEILEKELGSNHSAVANPLNNLAVLYGNRGDYDQAEPLYKRALMIKEKAFGPNHRDVATTLHNLAGLYQDKGDYAQAEPLHYRSLAIRENDPNNPDVVFSLNNLARMYSAKGDYIQAEPLFKRALLIWEKTLSPNHPNVAKLLNSLASLYRATENTSQALAFQRRAADVSEFNMSRYLIIGSERQKLAYIATLSGESDRITSLHVHSAPNDLAARNLAATTILQRKGRILDAVTDSLSALRRRFNPQDQALLDQWKDSSAQLARLVLGGPQKMSPAERQKLIKALEEKKEQFEAEISRSSAEFRAQLQPITMEIVQAAIPAEEALIEFALYRPFNPKYTKPSERFGQPQYVAYVLRREGQPQWVDLGAAKPIDEAIDAWRRALRNGKADVNALSRVVDEKVMRPVRTLLGKTSHILLSPDGALNLVPFAALVDERGRFLLENYRFTYLTSGRDLLRLQTRIAGREKPMVVAAPQFDEEGTVLAAGQTAKQAEMPSESTRRSTDFTAMNFRALPGTSSEAEALGKLLPQGKVLTGRQATEIALKGVSGPEILHIATHGFFLPDQEPEAAPRAGEMMDGLPRAMRTENPLLRSGLALAGANKQQGGNGEDGILTALEAAGLDLWGTKLVVLSACETGVGDVRNGEGVYGLRRAMVLAGAESQVMSLWQVSDDATRDLMVDYYKRLLAGEGRGEALRQVQLKMLADFRKAQGAERGVRKNNVAWPRRSHPYYWASFIQSGEWANLQGQR